MAKPGKIPTKRRGRGIKTSTIDELQELFEKGDGIVLMNNKRMTVSHSSALRSQLREQGVAVKIAKNTLIRIALERAGYDTSTTQSLLSGPTVLAVGLNDPVSAAKGITAFLKEFKDEEPPIEVKGGLLEKKVIGISGVTALSNMPGREEMLASLLGSMMAPAQNLAYGLNAAVSQFAWALSAYQRQMEEQQGGA